MRRWPLYAAIVYAVLLFVGLFIVPTAPEATDSGVKIVEYYRDHADGVRLIMWLSAWSAVPIVLLIAVWRSRLSGIARDVTLLGGASLVITTVIWSWFNLGLALHPKSLDPGVARTVSDVGGYFGPVLTVSIVLMIAPIGLAAWRGDGFPRWLAWVTLVFLIEQCVETVTIFGRSGFIEPGGAMNLTLGAGCFLIWIICAGAATVARDRAPVPA
jgi:hypothetical protein